MSLRRLPHKKSVKIGYGVMKSLVAKFMLILNSVSTFKEDTKRFEHGYLKLSSMIYMLSRSLSTVPYRGLSANIASYMVVKCPKNAPKSSYSSQI